MHLPFWLSITLLAPLLVWQGKQTRRTQPRQERSLDCEQGLDMA